MHEREVSKLEIESLKEQNEQLFQQYEREKGFHKEYHQVSLDLMEKNGFSFVYLALSTSRR